MYGKPLEKSATSKQVVNNIIGNGKANNKPNLKFCICLFFLKFMYANTNVITNIQGNIIE